MKVAPKKSAGCATDDSQLLRELNGASGVVCKDLSKERERRVKEAVGDILAQYYNNNNLASTDCEDRASDLWSVWSFPSSAMTNTPVWSTASIDSWCEGGNFFGTGRMATTRMSDILRRRKRHQTL
jgi:hypothetical protein